jgi:phytoene dehydrogenase-like protein
MRHYDALIVGAGHNGLVCAFYLARAGLRVRILERRGIVGGAAVTEEFHPGFRNSVASYTVSLLHPNVIADMRLADHGYRVIERPLANFLPQPDGRYLIIGNTLERTQAEVGKFSPRDADRLADYHASLAVIADQLRELAMRTPPNVGDGVGALLEGWRTMRRTSHLALSHKRDLLDLFTKSAAAFLDGWFESDPLKAAFGFDAIVGNYASPDTPGSAYVLLHHVMGEVNGKRGTWGHSMGGMGGISQAMARACEAAGVDISLEAPVAQVLVDGGGIAGLRLESGEEIAARVVVANVGPRLLYERMMDPADLPNDFRRRIRNFRTGSGTFRINVALSQLPRFSALPEEGEHLQSGIILAPSLAYMDRAFLDAQAYGWARQPVVEMLIPSIVDDSLAREGGHVASLFCQHFAPHLPDGRSWDDAREAAADTVLDTVESYAPGFKASVVGRMSLSPLDLERRFGLIDGDIMHGAMSLDQLWSARPVLGNASYRGPVRGLYMCGAGTHPGGGVSGLPGHNAARELLRDQRWWRRRAGSR